MYLIAMIRFKSCASFHTNTRPLTWLVVGSQHRNGFLNQNQHQHIVLPHNQAWDQGAKDNVLMKKQSSKVTVSSWSTLRSQKTNESSEDGPKKKFPLPNPVTIVTNVVKSSIAFQATFRKKFSTLSRKAKLVVSLQLMALLFMLGFGVKNVGHIVVSGRQPHTAMTKPVEVPYSVFLNMVEKSGQGHVPGQNPALIIDNIVIGRDKIGFKVKPDETKHELALKDKKLVESKDVSVQNVRERQLYTYKVNANPDLIKFLRDNTMPFRAASDKGSNAAALLARSSILIIYMLFLLRMYRTMAGGGKSDTPGKLAKQLMSDPKTMIKFDDIEGIDGAKFEVMELVDSLKNPGKYAILGARAPTGALLEGPPGVGKTMLARACAATAGVPLLYCSGSDFVEVRLPLLFFLSYLFIYIYIY